MIIYLCRLSFGISTPHLIPKKMCFYQFVCTLPLPLPISQFQDIWCMQQSKSGFLPLWSSRSRETQIIENSNHRAFRDLSIPQFGLEHTSPLFFTSESLPECRPFPNKPAAFPLSRSFSYFIIFKATKKIEIVRWWCQRCSRWGEKIEQGKRLYRITEFHPNVWHIRSVNIISYRPSPVIFFSNPMSLQQKGRVSERINEQVFASQKIQA